MRTKLPVAKLFMIKSAPRCASVLRKVRHRDVTFLSSALFGSESARIGEVARENERACSVIYPSLFPQ